MSEILIGIVSGIVSGTGMGGGTMMFIFTVPGRWKKVYGGRFLKNTAASWRLEIISGSTRITVH